ncbi:MAG: hypothetical protein SO179_05385 [Bacteroidales bacterium]|nr:hypothetical protein [Bacteroidales bacterium]
MINELIDNISNSTIREFIRRKNSSFKNFERGEDYSDILKEDDKFSELIKFRGSLTYIIPKIFLTTQTKKNMRDLMFSKKISYIFDTANSFEFAILDTCMISIINQSEKDNKIKFLDGIRNLLEPDVYKVNQCIQMHRIQ